MSQWGKGKAKKVSVVVLVDYTKSLMGIPLDNKPNLLDDSNDIIDKEERLDVIEDEQKLSKEELDLAKEFFMKNATLEGIVTLVEAELLYKEVVPASASGVDLMVMHHLGRKFSQQS